MGNFDFTINEKNKNVWDKHFIKTQSDDNVFTRGENGELVKATPLNDDPEIQEYGAVVELLENALFEHEYKIFKKDSKLPIDFITETQLELYDVVGIINDWKEFAGFFVFLGLTDDNTKFMFKYFNPSNDSIRKYTPSL